MSPSRPPGWRPDLDGPAGSDDATAVLAALRTRRMVRAYRDDPVTDEVVDEVLGCARLAPRAGNTDAIEFLVLRGDDVATYWATTMPAEVQRTFRWPGLLQAPVLVVPYVRPAAYPDRYGEGDKARTGLGASTEAWPVPYWWVDGGAAAQNLLVAAHALGLGACLFGQFAHEAAVRDRFGVPGDRRAIGTVSLGWPAEDRPGRSAGRPRRELTELVHHGRWRTQDD